MELIREALNEDIAPYLNNEAAKRAAAIASGAVEELIKRQSRTPADLQRLLGAGVVIAGKLAAHAGGALDSELSQRLSALEHAAASSFAATDRTQLYDELLRLMEELARLQHPNELEGSKNQRLQQLQLLAEAAHWENSVEQAQLVPLEQSSGSRAVAEPLTAEKLQAFLQRMLPEESNVEVRDFKLIPAGMVHDTYEFTLTSNTRSPEALIVRKTKGEPIVRIHCFELHREFDLVRDLARAGYPLPEALWLGREVPGITGDFYVMRKARGSKNADLFTVTSTIPKRVLLQMAEQLARLHSLPLSVVSNYIEHHCEPSAYRESAEQSTRRNVRAWHDRWRSFVRRPSPAEVYMFAWLMENVPPNDAPASLVHADFSPHNCLWEGDELTAVLDWEGAHFGDPAEDIAYIKPHIAGRMDWDEWLAHYQAHGGAPVDEKRIAYYTCYVHMRTVILANVITTGAQLGGSGDIIALQIDYEYLPRTLQLCLESIRSFEA